MRARSLVVVACLLVQGCAAGPPQTSVSASGSPTGSESPPEPTSLTTPPPTETETETPGDADVPVSARWERVPGLPDDGAWERGLYDVSAASPDLAWAAGYKGWEDEVAMTLRHWDGSGWRMLPAGYTGSLAAVDADGPGNVWAVGGGSFDKPVALHWNGSSWRRHRSPMSTRDVAVDGARVVLMSSFQVMEGDGARWTRKLGVSRPGSELRAVSAGGGHTWIAGTRMDRPMIWHGTAGGYREAELPGVPESGTLGAVWQNSPSDVWAVGATGERPLVMRWNGSSWQRVALPADWRGKPDQRDGLRPGRRVDREPAYRDPAEARRAAALGRPDVDARALAVARRGDQGGGRTDPGHVTAVAGRLDRERRLRVDRPLPPSLTADRPGTGMSCHIRRLPVVLRRRGRRATWRRRSW